MLTEIWSIGVLWSQLQIAHDHVIYKMHICLFINNRLLFKIFLTLLQCEKFKFRHMKSTQIYTSFEKMTRFLWLCQFCHWCLFGYFLSNTVTFFSWLFIALFLQFPISSSFFFPLREMSTSKKHTIATQNKITKKKKTTTPDDFTTEASECN